MTIPVKKLGEISLAIFESIFASKICNFQDTKAIISYFNEFDESILSLIHEKINDEYELEKVDDYILKIRFLLNENINSLQKMIK